MAKRVVKYKDVTVAEGTVFWDLLESRATVKEADKKALENKIKAAYKAGNDLFHSHFSVEDWKRLSAHQCAALPRVGQLPAEELYSRSLSNVQAESDGEDTDLAPSF